MKKLLFFNLPILMLIGISCVPKSVSQPNEKAEVSFISDSHSDYDSVAVYRRVESEVNKVKAYLNKKKGQYNEDLAILVDMRLSSKYFRLFVTDLNTKKIISRGMVAHGAGSEIEGTDSLQFSNTPESYMTSLGMYKVGAAYQGSFGRSFKLHGLEKTNDKALARAIVLHRYQCVPDDEQAYPICTSLGCIMLSENYFEIIAKYIDASKNPLLMNVYY